MPPKGQPSTGVVFRMYATDVGSAGGAGLGRKVFAEMMKQAWPGGFSPAGVAGVEIFPDRIELVGHGGGPVRETIRLDGEQSLAEHYGAALDEILRAKENDQEGTFSAGVPEET